MQARLVAATREKEWGSTIRRRSSVVQVLPKVAAIFDPDVTFDG
jgi:hypothetical protein